MCTLAYRFLQHSDQRSRYLQLQLLPVEFYGSDFQLCKAVFKVLSFAVFAVMPYLI